ncbi:hypothetical protein BDV40DRAFT_301956 [Aspergillus tamarii]|uniref:Uncharacterized protein n=1 Tax=Aspergillus tamarii TaxID=41984 RepID=A0A5N6UQD6_ASPTM|nr:hypothetical protein BDV40DRAFT_301956 [Aspergillus tamarii]
MPTDTEWVNLRRHGHSLEITDSLIRWFGCSCQLADLPDEILEGQLDNKIKEAIFDHQFAETIEEKLRECIYKCYGNWTKRIREDSGNRFISEEGEKIRDNLLKMRMLLTYNSWNSYCQEMTREDMLQYCTAQYQSIRHHIQQGNTDLYDLYMVHRQVLAFIKIFTLSKLIPEQLSARDTGDMLLLA